MAEDALEATKLALRFPNPKSPWLICDEDKNALRIFLWDFRRIGRHARLL